MWAIVLITAILTIFLYIKIIGFIDSKKYYKEYKHIFDAHKELSYPKLTDEQQYKILDSENWNDISNLTEYKFVPTGLLNYYITVDPQKYLDHLRSLNLNAKIKFDVQNVQDGFFINQTAKGFDYLFVERNKIVFRKKFSKYETLLKYIAYDNLDKYAPKNYKFAWLKKRLL